MDEAQAARIRFAWSRRSPENEAALDRLGVAQVELQERDCVNRRFGANVAPCEVFVFTTEAQAGGRVAVFCNRLCVESDFRDARLWKGAY